MFTASKILTCATAVLFASAANAQSELTGGQTSVNLDLATLSSIGLNLDSISDDVIAPGENGPFSVAFPINPRSGDEPTTFSYAPGTLAPFAGTIEHTGTITFVGGATVGNFSIGFDAGRVTSVNSGFFVESTATGTGAVAAILFDVENPSELNAGAASLSIAGNLLVSPEFASFLGNTALTGADVGDALIVGSVLEPTPEGSLVSDGQTNVLLDTALLGTVGVSITGVSTDVIAPGALGAASVAFPINARTSANPTSFFYEPATLAPFGGSIEHTGVLDLDASGAPVSVGNFTIGFDAGRAVGNASGFFVESTFTGTNGVAAILFDVAAPSALDAQADSLSITADLLISPEFANFLGNAGLTGVDIGDALVDADALPGEVSSFTDFCNGDGGDQLGCTDCPCGNNAAAGTIGGCVNESGLSARVRGYGSASVTAADPADLRFQMLGGNPGALAVLTSGDNLAPQNMANPCFGQGSGAPSAVLDGIRCAVGSTWRHGSRKSDANGDVGVTNNGWGGAAAPHPGIAIQGGFVSGQTRYFQVFYRASDSLGCMTGQNTTQAIGVTFQL